MLNCLNENLKLLLNYRIVLVSNLGIRILFLIFVFSSNLFSQSTFFFRSENEFDNRYEGSRSKKFGYANIDLLAFYSVIEDYKRNDILKVFYYLHDDSTQIQIKAQELGVQLSRNTSRNTMYAPYYLMKAHDSILDKNSSVGWNVFAPWPVNDVLLRRGFNITSDNLGVLINSRKEKEKIVPALVVTHRSKLPQRIGKYNLHFYTATTITRGYFEVYSVNPDSIIVKEDIGYHSFDKSFLLQFDISGVSESLVKLEVVIKFENLAEEIFLPTYYFYHQPFYKKEMKNR